MSYLFSPEECAHLDTLDTPRPAFVAPDAAAQPDPDPAAVERAARMYRDAGQPLTAGVLDLWAAELRGARRA